MVRLELKNVKLIELAEHKNMNLYAAVGFRSIIIFDDELKILGKFLDSNIHEKYQCASFIDLTADWNVLEGNRMRRNKEEKRVESNEKQIETVEDYTSLNESSCDENKKTYLVLGGESGLIKVIDVGNGKIVQILRGHTGTVTCLKTFDEYVISGSTDSSARLWDVRTGECISVMASILGHKDAILSVDLHYTKKKIITAGIDCTIKEWDIEKHLKANKMKKVETTDIIQSKPKYNYKEIHKSPITKIKYYGDLIVSLGNKSVGVIASGDLNISQLRAAATEKKVRNVKFLYEDIKCTSILIGRIDLYKTCKFFDIQNHTLIAMSEVGEAYMFDLKQIWEETTPFIIETNVKKVENFLFSNGRIIITEGSFLEAFDFDM